MALRKRDVADRMHSAAIHLLRRVREADAKTGMTPARLSALSLLVFGGPCTLSDLAKNEGVTPTRLMQGLRATDSLFGVLTQPTGAPSFFALQREGRICNAD
jgi:hypothetical protein